MPDASGRAFNCLKALGIHDRIHTVQLSLQDFQGVLHLLKTIRPEEIYNLSSQVECGAPGEDLRICDPNIEQGTQNVLEALRMLGNRERFFQAASGEKAHGLFAKGPGEPVADRGPDDPATVEEARAKQQIAFYRQKYDVFACTGVIFNRDSPLQPGHALSKRIAGAAVQIAAGKRDHLRIDHPNEVREWGWAPEYADAYWRILQQQKPADYVIGTGRSYSVAAFTEAAFDAAGLDWSDYVDVAAEPPERERYLAADISKVQRLGWKAEIGMEGVAALMVSSERLSGIL